jgi:alpha-mannosidase
VTGYAFKPDEKVLEFLLLRVRPLPGGVWGQMHPSIKGIGHHVFDCALVPHAGTWRDAASYRDALEAHVPLVAFSPEVGLHRTRPGIASPAKIQAPQDRASFAEVTPANVVLSSLRLVKPSSGKGSPEIELRLYETAGRELTDVTIRLARPVRNIAETNFLGRPSHEFGSIALQGNAIHLRLPAWKIANLRVRAED